MAPSYNLSPHQFKEHTYTFSHSESENGHIINAHKGKRAVGQLRWSKPGPNDQRVLAVEVDEDHQHKGVATAMWNHAREIAPGISHSAFRTTEGDAWAQKVGGPLPKNRQLSANAKWDKQ